MLYNVPTAVLLVAAITLAVAIACTAQTFVHRRFKNADFVAHNEVAGFIIAVVGTLYAVVLGFFTVIVWQQYDGMQDRLALETAAVIDAWHDAVGFPPAIRSRLRADMLAYTHEMIDVEWPRMERGGFSARGDALIMDATGTVGTYVPHNGAETNAQAAALQLLTELHDARLRRLSSNEQGFSWFDWAVLVIGAAIVIGFCFLFGMRNTRTHLIMTSCVAAIIVSMFVMIFELQYPFRGDLRIRPTAWVGLLGHIRYMDTQSPTNMRM
ncbi:MAG TPA: DUF4239 domain-containing protein [Candidatus Limnocylindria bacterium]|nr:DUF4239 domain-containing protein [Candidatus Limnocylindria bacterium]